MALWICRGCTAAYSVDAPACPQCGSTDHLEDWTMPKISKGGGPSYEPAAEPERTVEQDPVAEPVDAESGPEAVAQASGPEPAPAPAPKD